MRHKKRVKIRFSILITLFLMKSHSIRLKLYKTVETRLPHLDLSIDFKYADYFVTGAGPLLSRMTRLGVTMRSASFFLPSIMAMDVSISFRPYSA